MGTNSLYLRSNDGTQVGVTPHSVAAKTVKGTIVGAWEENTG